jgi:ribonuclease R
MARRAKPTKEPKARRRREVTPDAALAARVHGRMPSKDEIVAFIREAGANADGSKVGKREIARAFGITGTDRVALKRLLSELGHDGVLAGTRKEFRERNALPPVGVVELIARDDDGDLIGEPVVWDNDDMERPRVRLVQTGRIEGDGTPEGAAAIGIGDRVLCRFERLELEEPGQTQFEAHPIKRVAREKRRLLGIFRSAARGGGVIKPIDRKDLRDYPVQKGNEGQAGDGDLVRFDLANQRRNAQPQARILEALGNPDDIRQISLIAIHAHGIPNDFPESVIAEAHALKPPAMERRVDLRALPLLTIDPHDARDHDDAVCAAPDTDTKNGGGWVVHVAIADVAYFVRPGTRLDSEAQLRGNSVYFPDRVVPMLPEAISNDLCSLREHEDRACLVVRLVFDATGEKRSHSFMRAMMRSAVKLSYQEAQAAIDGQPSPKAAPFLESALKPLWAAYHCVSQARNRRQPLDLDLPERKIVMDGNGKVARIFVPERLAAHRLIEEFMIQANVAAAETLEQQRTPCVYRVHDQPSKDKLKSLKDVLETLGLNFPGSGTVKAGQFNEVLHDAKDSANPELANEVVLRAQAQAEYAVDNYGHFGLNLRRYAHFTSPIRRYADLLVHRALIKALDLGAGGLDSKPPVQLGGRPEKKALGLKDIAKAISDAERRAMGAERETTDRLIAAHLADRTGATFDARISGVTRSGLFVRLTETGANGFIPVSTLGAEYFQHVEGSQALVGSRSGNAFSLGDAVEVKLIEVIPSAGAMRFEMLSLPKAPRGSLQKGWRPQRLPKGRRPPPRGRR